MAATVWRDLRGRSAVGAVRARGGGTAAGAREATHHMAPGESVGVAVDHSRAVLPHVEREDISGDGRVLHTRPLIGDGELSLYFPQGSATTPHIEILVLGHKLWLFTRLK